MKITSHCQICGRAIKASAGIIAHHGYERPGNGWQTRSCFGARYQPYEVSCSALAPFIESVGLFKVKTETALATLKASPPETLMYRLASHLPQQSVARPEGFNPEQISPVRAAMHGSYERQFSNWVRKHEREITSARIAIEEAQKRLAAWKAPVQPEETT